MSREHGVVEVRVSRRPHDCSPPGWWQRRKLDLGYGSVWRCPCGRRWEWRFVRDGVGGVGAWCYLNRCSAS